MDFAKAFDKVNHSLLIHTLRYYGIDGKSSSFAIVRDMMVSSAKSLTLEVSLDWKSLM
jgi:hypothetical protein